MRMAIYQRKLKYMLLKLIESSFECATVCCLEINECRYFKGKDSLQLRQVNVRKYRYGRGYADEGIRELQHFNYKNFLNLNIEAVCVLCVYATFLCATQIHAQNFRSNPIAKVMTLLILGSTLTHSIQYTTRVYQCTSTGIYMVYQYTMQTRMFMTSSLLTVSTTQGT